MASFLREQRHVRSATLSIERDSDAGILQHSRPVEPRSPPNTSHVPCKFFRQGTCQAGNACPFSHDIGATSELVCKYFNKGNCKFGPKCANIHMLANGRRINYHKNSITIGDTPVALIGRTSNGPMPVPVPVPGPYNPSALTSGLYHNENGLNGQNGSQQNPFRTPSITTPYGPYTGDDNSLSIDAAAAPYSTTGSVFGSPPNDDAASRFGLALSPIGKGLSVLDAPLPASFDSNGISHAARFPAAPWPSSMPAKYGFDSPAASLGAGRDMAPSDAVRMLHSSAFYGSELAPTPPNPSASPPPLGPPGDELYDKKRILHSSRFAKPRVLSSSLPKRVEDHRGGPDWGNPSEVDRDWDGEFSFVEEDYVPHDLQELLTPAEKARRGSVRADDASDGSRFGSPSGASPSRWGPLFQRQREEELENSPRFSKYPPATFGHVGSPLRNSSLAHEISKQANPSGPLSRLSPGVRAGTDSLSVLTQQLQRSKLAESLEAVSSPRLHPSSAARNIGAVGRERVGLERHLSSGSTGSRFATPIEEEDPAFVFELDEDEPREKTKKKRTSSGLSAGVWSYAGVVAGRGAPATTTKATATATATTAKEATPRPIGGR